MFSVFNVFSPAQSHRPWRVLFFYSRPANNDIDILAVAFHHIFFAAQFFEFKRVAQQAVQFNAVLCCLFAVKPEFFPEPVQFFPQFVLRNKVIPVEENHQHQENHGSNEVFVFKKSRDAIE